MTDLLDLLQALEAPPTVTHVLMPSMAFACGRNMLDDGGRFQVGINDWAAIDCPDCRAFDPDDLLADMRRQQGDQAGVA